MNTATQRTLDSPSEFAGCRDRFLATPLADSVLRWGFPQQARHAIVARAQSLHSPEDFQQTYVHPLFQRILDQTTQGLSISGLDALPRNRKFLFLSNHRCIVTDAALVSLNLLASGRGTCKVCVGDNLMTAPGVTELMLLLNGVSIKRSGSRRDVYANAKEVASYLAQQIDGQRYSVWLSQSPGRTKDGNDRTATAIVKMLGLHGDGRRADFEALHIVPVAISYEFEPCAVQKVRETLLRRAHGHYHKQSGEDVAQIRDSLVADKGRVHLAFGEELRLSEASGISGDAVVQDIVDQADHQIWRNYRCWESNHIAHAQLSGTPWDLQTPYAQAFMSKLNTQVVELQAQSLDGAAAREALLQLYAQPVLNAQRAAETGI